MVLLLGAVAGSGLPLSFILVYAVGFLAAVGIGSIAWYNSRRPPGWEMKDRPGFIPKVSNPDQADE
ncbi:MAG TPA: hypothetical protein V6D07_12020 [Trichocoleus sp.]